MIIAITGIMLLVFLVTKELTRASDSESAQRVARFLTIPIIPLLILFVVMVVLRIIELAA